MTQLVSRLAMTLPLGEIDRFVTGLLARSAPRVDAQACNPDCTYVYICNRGTCCDINYNCVPADVYCDHCGGAVCYIDCYY